MLDVLTEEQVAKRLSVSLASVRRWRLEKRGSVFKKVGALVRYRPEDVDAWLDALPTGGSVLTPKSVLMEGAPRASKAALLT